MDQPFILKIIIGVLTTGIPMSIPFLFAGLGEMFTQRSGIFNLGVEGIMMLSAFTGFFVVYKLGSPVLGIIAAIIVGGLMGLLMGVVSISFKATQGISGIGLYMFGWGLSGALFRLYVGGITSIEGLRPWNIPVFNDIPIIGPIFFRHNWLVYLAFIMVPLAWFVLFKTRWGLKVRAVGNTPRAADTMGINVNKTRYQCVILGSMMAGLAGAYLTIGQAFMYADNITAGRGFIAVALVYFGRWHPKGILLGAILFSMAHSFQRWIQVFGISFPYEIAVVMPYVLVIVVLAFRFGKVRAPAALGQAYYREFRG
jgi:general nucleoside transport system permease protein